MWAFIIPVHSGFSEIAVGFFNDNVCFSCLVGILFLLMQLETATEGAT